MPVPSLNEQGGCHEFLRKLSRQRTARNADSDIRSQVCHEISSQQVSVGNVSEGEQCEPRALDRAQRNDDNCTLRYSDGALIGLHSVHSFQELPVRHYILSE